jgi:hypothetical protein
MIAGKPTYTILDMYWNIGHEMKNLAIRMLGWNPRV